MELVRRTRRVLADPLAHLTPQARLLAAQLVVLCLPVALFTLVHPYPLAYPDPATYSRIVATMVEEGTLLATWDPPVRYFLHYALALAFGGTGAPFDRLGVFQAGVFSYLLVPLAAYGLFSTARSPAAGLAAVVSLTIARVARIPPSAVVWHHWQIDTGYPFAFAALALAVATVRANRAGDHRREVGYGALTAATCGLTLNAEPWIALFCVAGIACAWVSYPAWRAIATAGLLGALAAAPVLLVPRWESHLAIFLVEVVDPSGPLFSVEAFVASVFTPGTLGVLALFGTSAWLWRRGTPLPGGWVIAFAVAAGLWTWALFTVTTLEGLGTRGLYWSLSVGIPAVVVQVAAAVDDDHPIAVGYRDLFVAPDRDTWIVLLGTQAVLLGFSVWLFLQSYAPPSG